MSGPEDTSHAAIADGAHEGVELLPSDPLRRPWTDPCDSCGGIGHAAGARLHGPCGTCWGLGWVLFAFEAVGDAAHVVPMASITAANLPIAAIGLWAER